MTIAATAKGAEINSFSSFMQRILTKVTSKFGTRAAIDLAELVKAGLTSASVNSFDRFLERYKDLKVPTWRVTQRFMAEVF